MGNTEARDTDSESRMFVVDEKTYGKNYQEHIMKQYKLCVEMADRISSRRCTANSFFLSLNSLLLAAIGILSRLGSDLSTFDFWWIVIVSFAGFVFCWCWSTIIRCYRELNSAKFKVVNTIEKRLPVAAFEAEWKLLNPETGATKYPQLTRVERWVPIVLATLYVVLMAIAIMLAIGPFFAGFYDP